ncbi:23_t:CDS:2 [Rhizophagus irregularis]|nr:23_t:CDS:2 [Rhizophagus irregularis]
MSKESTPAHFDNMTAEPDIPIALTSGTTAMFEMEPSVKRAIDHDEDPDKFMIITEKDIDLAREYRNRMMERLISEEIQLLNFEEMGTPRVYVYDDDEWKEALIYSCETSHLWLQVGHEVAEGRIELFLHGAVFAVVKYGATNLSNAMTIASEALGHCPIKPDERVTSSEQESRHVQSNNSSNNSSSNSNSITEPKVSTKGEIDVEDFLNEKLKLRKQENFSEEIKQRNERKGLIQKCLTRGIESCDQNFQDRAVVPESDTISSDAFVIKHLSQKHIGSKLKRNFMLEAIIKTADYDDDPFKILEDEEDPFIAIRDEILEEESN